MNLKLSKKKFKEKIQIKNLKRKIKEEYFKKLLLYIKLVIFLNGFRSETYFFLS